MKETIGETIAQQFNGATMGTNGEKNVDNEEDTVGTIRGQRENNLGKTGETMG